MSKKIWIIFASVCVLAFIGIIIFKPGDTPFTGDPTKVVADDHVYGNKDSKVVFIEYGDFQCPGCGSAEPIVQQVREAYKDKIAFVYRYMPLVSIHPNAKAAAAAAEAAGQQGKFWEMHDALYANQNAWAEASSANRGSYFEEYAQQINLDMTKYRAAIASTTVLDRISRDQSAASKAGLQPSTPTFVLNGRKLDLTTELSVTTNGSSNFSFSKYSETLNKELKKFNITPPSSDAATDTTAPTTTSNQ
jgi:protein-disulfide isomerase